MKFTVKHNNNGAQVSLSERSLSPTLTELEISVVFDKPTVPEPIRIGWSTPILDIYRPWGPSIGTKPSLGYDWAKRITSSRLASGAPLMCWLSQGGSNRLTVALSDAASPHEIAGGVREEDASLDCRITLFTRPISAITSYSVTARFDCADRSLEKSVAEIDGWWADACGYPRAYVPDAAKKPMYSTWYSFHQRTIPDEILYQCRLAKEMGMDAVIVDDGWQTEDGNRGYAYCGDWEVCTSKIPDMKAFVDGVHALGMKFILWYSVPFVGTQSKMYKRFSDKVLGRFHGSGDEKWTCLDPRYPDVREALTDIYRRAKLEWGLDGFKLDFIDSFELHSAESFAYDARRDTQSLEEGIDLLLDGITRALREIDPEVLIEFRQSYIGPVIRKYGNMFRIADCPDDAVQNRTNGVLLRNLLRGSAVHSDMLMWNYGETPEAAAKQVISALITVPQISVLLDRIPESHRKMLENYLDFWHTHRETLTEGELICAGLDANYSIVTAQGAGESITVAYLPVVLNVSAENDRTVFVNGTSESRLTVRFASDIPWLRFRVYDCMGNMTEDDYIPATGDVKIEEFDVPESGRIELFKDL